MLQSEEQYYHRRAIMEREMALQAADPKAGEIHLELARRYDAMATEPETAELLRAVA